MELQDALPGVDEKTIAEVKIGGDENFHSPSSAARALANYRYEKLKKEQASDEQPKAEPGAVEESAPADATPPQEATGETQATDPVPASAEPSIEPPRSWSKDARERWAKLDPATQQIILERDRADIDAVRKAQNDAAEVRKALEAERVKLEQTRQQFEANIPQQLTAAQAILAIQFPDIRTDADIDRLSAEDPYRYSQLQRAMEKLGRAQQEAFAAEQSAAEEKRTKFDTFAKDQDERFKKNVPDAADPSKVKEIETRALKTLSDLGFEQAELAKAWTGQGDISLRDSRMQELIWKAALWDKAQSDAVIAKAKAAEKPVPPVQRPGVSKSAGAQAEAETQALSQRLAKSGNIRDAVALRLAQRRA